MTLETIGQFATEFDDAVFLIGLAILLIEIAKGLFGGSLKGRGLLDMVASASTQIPYLLVEIFLMSFVYIAMVMIAENFVSWQLPLTWWTVALALLACDFTYYWEHRMAHEIRLLWTQHAVHHSSRKMNILIAIRFGPFESFASALFHIPLIFLGFPPELVFAGIIIVLGYQTWIHTELIGKLGPLEAVLNTPANHRVHHGCDDKYIDKNYGGILIVWDRLFGTYQREEETPRYGLKRDYDSVNPLSVWFSEWPSLFADLKTSKSFSDSFMYIFGRPGWQPKQKASRKVLLEQGQKG
ncbi:MAG: sterol desaturase family protein [Henriciella sp.]|nr:sterol desaturase family protein [Henriciella sp.]